MSCYYMNFWNFFNIRNHEVLCGQQKQVTRFISLSNVDNPDKKNRVSVIENNDNHFDTIIILGI